MYQVHRVWDIYQYKARTHQHLFRRECTDPPASRKTCRLLHLLSLFWRLLRASLSICCAEILEGDYTVSFLYFVEEEEDLHRASFISDCSARSATKQLGDSFVLYSFSDMLCSAE